MFIEPDPNTKLNRFIKKKKMMVRYLSSPISMVSIKELYNFPKKKKSFWTRAERMWRGYLLLLLYLLVSLLIMLYFCFSMLGIILSKQHTKLKLKYTSSQIKITNWNQSEFSWQNTLT